MANVISPKNGLPTGTHHGAWSAYEMHGSPADENLPLGRTASTTSTTRTTNGRRLAQPVTPTRKEPSTSHDAQNAKKTVNGTRKADGDDDDDIPENMYRPEKDDPEGWIHRDKLAKIESEELQAAGINLANARSRSQSRMKSVRSNASSESDGRREEKRQRLQSPAEIEEEVERATWDFRLPDEIDAEMAAGTTASQMYSNPVLRKSGSKIPVMTSSPLPIPSERYERDTPIARKRTASGSMSLEIEDLNVFKPRNASTSKGLDESDTTSTAVVSSKPSSPQKQRSKSGTLSPSPAAAQKKVVPLARKVSAPPRATPSPSHRPGTRSGEQDRPRTSHNPPEGDPPWLATMYKPDPMLPPDQQLIPTLAKKQMQAQWAAEGAVPKAYDREFTPIDIHNQEDLARDRLQNRTPSPVQADLPGERSQDPNTFGLKALGSITSNNGRPGTSGSITGGYSTMPKVMSPPLRAGSPKFGHGASPNPGARSTTAAPPSRMQAQSLAQDEDEKVKKGCGCCIVM